MDRDQRLDRNEILVFLSRIEEATHSAPPGKLALFADGFVKERVNGGEMADALRGCLREWKQTGFPPFAKILDWARPEAVNQPRREEGTHYDAIVDLEKQIEILTGWARRFEDQGDIRRRDEAERDIRKHREHIDRRLEARGKPARYARDGAELWTGQL